jgi:hypothetical protein
MDQLRYPYELKDQLHFAELMDLTEAGEEELPDDKDSRQNDD